MNCTAYLNVNFGMTCQDVREYYDLTIDEFYTWNPEVGPQCEGLWENYSYCVSLTQLLADAGENSPDTTSTGATTTSATTATTTTGISIPGPTQSGIAADCITYYLAQVTDTCNSIETSFGITDIQFHSWNPAVSTDCLSGLWADEAYCVGVAGTAASSTTSTTSSAVSTTSTSPAVPSPTQPNSIISSCNKYAVAADGDYCYLFATEHGITTEDLYAWNTVLGTAGANCATAFFLGYYYCVGVASSR